MNIRLTLRDAAGNIVMTKDIYPRSMTRLAGDVGQAAHELYGEAKQAGHYPIGTTLSVEEFESDTADVLARAREIVRKGQR